jgi:hypothetical protein
MYGTNMLRFFKSHARYFYPYVNILEKLLDGSLYKQQYIYIYIYINNCYACGAGKKLNS